VAGQATIRSALVGNLMARRDPGPRSQVRFIGRVIEGSSDCEAAYGLMKKETLESQTWRVHWVACLILLRAVGYVLEKVDGERHDRNGVQANPPKAWGDWIWKWAIGLAPQSGGTIGFDWSPEGVIVNRE